MLADWSLDLKTWAHLSLCVCVCVCVCARARACLCVLRCSIMSNSSQLWTVVHQAPLSTGSSKQESWSRLSFPPPEYLPDPGIEPTSVCPTLQADSLPLNHQGSIYHCAHFFFFKYPDYLLSCLFYWEEYTLKVFIHIKNIVVQLLSHIWLFIIPWTATRQVSLSFTISQSLLKLMSIESGWHPTISPSVALFSFCIQSFPGSGSFPMSQLFTSGGQRIGVLALSSVFPRISRVDFL